MEKTLIFGHKSPDTDTITSAIVMADFEKKLGNDVEACRLGNLNKETKYVFDYLKINAPRLIEKVEEGQNVILVDHNEFKQSVDGIENANILKVIDHHTMDFKTSYQLFYHSEPVGCTATVLYKLYKQNGFEIDKNIAILMISAIISDTLLFKSPTCTDDDVKAVEELNKIAGLDINSYGTSMLKAGTDFSDVSETDLINLDAKEFMIGDIKTVVAQVSTVDIDEMMKRKDKIEDEIKKVIEDKKLGLFLFAITDIMNSNSQVIVLGENSNIVSLAYNVKLENNTAFLPGVVSRKKQIIPIISKVAN